MKTKRLTLIIGIIAFSLCGFFSMQALAIGNTPPQTPATETADGIISNLWPIIMDKQVLYQASNDKFYQGLVTHSIIPTGGVSSTLDMVYSHPSDQVAHWADFLGPDLPSELPFAIYIEPYETTTDSGFTAFFSLNEGGIIYQRSLGTGSQGINKDWHPLPVITLP